MYTKLITAISLGKINIVNVEPINTQVAPVNFPLVSCNRSIDLRKLLNIIFITIERILKYSITIANNVKGTKILRTWKRDSRTNK
jgi:hypothetical protein